MLIPKKLPSGAFKLVIGDFMEVDRFLMEDRVAKLPGFLSKDDRIPKRKEIKPQATKKYGFPFIILYTPYY